MKLIKKRSKQTTDRQTEKEADRQAGRQVDRQAGKSWTAVLLVCKIDAVPSIPSVAR